MIDRSQKPSRFKKLTPVLDLQTDGQGTRDKLAVGVFVAVLLVLMTSGYLLIQKVEFNFFKIPASQFDWWRKEFKVVEELIEQARQYLPGQEVIKPLQKGHRLYKNQKYHQAIDQYSEAIEKEPSDFKAYFWRGRAYMKMNQYDRAIGDFKMTIQLNSKYRAAFDNLGWLYGQQGKYDVGLQVLNRSIELAPDRGWTYFYRGYIYQIKGDMKNALKDYHKACQLKYHQACQIYQEMKRERLS